MQRDEEGPRRAEVQDVAIRAANPGPLDFEADELRPVDRARFRLAAPGDAGALPLKARDDGRVEVDVEVAADVPRVGEAGA